MSGKFSGIPVVVAHFNESGAITKTESYNLENIAPLDDWQVDSFARSLLPVIQDYYSHEENRRAFEAWLTEQNELTKLSQI